MANKVTIPTKVITGVNTDKGNHRRKHQMELCECLGSEEHQRRRSEV